MRRKKILSCILAVTCIATLLSGCGINVSHKREPIKINAAYANMDAFVEKLHEKYPEIDIEIVPYAGQNTTVWMKSMLKSGELPDVYFTTYYSAENDMVSDKLLDLSKYDFTDNYEQARLREVMVDGSIYMLPMFYTCFGITYNKTILEENGWELPKSLKELEELKPKAEEKGYTFCVDLTDLPGSGFNILFNILSTDFVNTPDGIQWQKDYLSQNANVSNTPQMAESMKLIDRWKELGLLTEENTELSDQEVVDLVKEGNTLFCVGNTFELIPDSEENRKDEFKLMPYLSENGDQNAYIMNTVRYAGLNKQLGEKGNEQKLEDALHVMEVLSSEEGMWSLNEGLKRISLLPLKDEKVASTNYYADAMDDLNSGFTAPNISSGWDNVIVPIGNTMLDFIKGKATRQDVINCMDESQGEIVEPKSYTTVTETLDTGDCARLVGIGFAQAVNADAALIAKNEYHAGAKSPNARYAVYGSLFPLPVTDQEITTIISGGWDGTIMTVTLTGKRIMEIAKAGYDMNEDGNPFPYELVTKDGTKLEDNKTYTVAICGATEELQTEGNMQDSGIMQLDAMKNYLSQFGSLSKKDIVWK